MTDSVLVAALVWTMVVNLGMTLAILIMLALHITRDKL